MPFLHDLVDQKIRILFLQEEPVKIQQQKKHPAADEKDEGVFLHRFVRKRVTAKRRQYGLPERHARRSNPYNEQRQQPAHEKDGSQNSPDQKPLSCSLA